MINQWCKSALIRKEQIESGVDITFNDVFKPLIINHVSSLNPSNVLEVGAGTGHIAKALSEHGFNITAIEPSGGMYEVAQGVLSQSDVCLINTSSYNLDKSLIFDVSISHLVVHTVDNIDSFFESINTSLHIGGVFIFSIPHPFFYNEYKNFFNEGDNYRYITPNFKKVSFNISKDPSRQIEDVPYHHRPLSIYINSILNGGFKLEKFEEVYPNEEIQKRYDVDWEVPRYCFFVCKKI